MATLAAAWGEGIPIRAWLSFDRTGGGAPVSERVTSGGRARDEGSETSLSDLTSAAARGDERAFEALHRRVGTGLRRVLMARCGGRVELVDDLSQTTWAAVWQALRTGKYDAERSAITTFVYAVGNNAWLTHLRKSGRRKELESNGVIGGGSDGAGSVSLDEAMEEAEQIELVRACVRDEGLAGLNDEERLIVRGMAAGESDRGLARRLGLSCSTVNVKKQRAFSKIREYLRGRGVMELGTRESGSASESRSEKFGSSSAGLAGGVS